MTFGVGKVILCNCVDHGAPGNALARAVGQREVKDLVRFHDVAGRSAGPILSAGRLSAQICDQGRIWIGGQQSTTDDRHAQRGMSLGRPR